MPPAQMTGVSIYDVAHRAGVSVVTVSRVFNDYPYVSDGMRTRVLTAARSVGYQPRLVTKRNLLAVLVGGLDHLASGDPSSRLLLGLVRAAAARGYLIEFMPSASAHRATQHLVDGLLEVGLSSHEVAALSDLPEVPRVAINNVEVDASWSVVANDPAAEVRLGVSHLLAHGHRRIALAHDSSRSWYARQRESAFQQAMDEAGLKAASLLVCPYQEAPRAMARRVRETCCTACLCLCSHHGLPLLDGLQRELGLRVPDDLSLIALENSRVSGHFAPRLTTLSQPLEQLAETAVAGLLEQVEGKRKERFVTLLQSHLIERDSVRQLGVRPPSGR